MILKPFYEKFPGIAENETRSITVFNHAHIPNGKYVFLEMYCPDYSCDCRKASILVLEDNAHKKMALISYGWASMKFYLKWGLSKGDAESLTKGYVDPLGENTKYSSYFLDIFLNSIKEEPDFKNRLKRHYKLYKNSLTSNDTPEKFIAEWRDVISRQGATPIK
jgi:hypothetical protein